MIFKKHRHYRNYKMCKKGAIAGFIVLAVILALFLLALAKQCLFKIWEEPSEVAAETILRM